MAADADVVDTRRVVDDEVVSPLLSNFFMVEDEVCMMRMFFEWLIHEGNFLKLWEESIDLERYYCIYRLRCI